MLATVAGAEAAWMVDDSLAADVRGAKAVGLPAILVCGPKRGTPYHCAGLYGIADIIKEESPRKLRALSANRSPRNRGPARHL